MLYRWPRKHGRPCGGWWALKLRTGWLVVRRMVRVSSPPRSMVIVSWATWTVTICPAWMRPRAIFWPDDHDHAGVAGPALDGDWLGGRAVVAARRGGRRGGGGPGPRSAGWAGCAAARGSAGSKNIRVVSSIRMETMLAAEDLRRDGDNGRPG